MIPYILSVVLLESKSVGYNESESELKCACAWSAVVSRSFYGVRLLPFYRPRAAVTRDVQWLLVKARHALPFMSTMHVQLGPNGF
jgi:hypothetical protein